MLADVQRIDVEERLARVDQWLREYIRQPHPGIGRSGPVCPFVAPAQRAGSLEARVRPIGPTPSVSLIVEMLRCALDEFSVIGWRGSNVMLRALLVVIPDLPDERLHLLDESQRVVKPEGVRRGMMLGQFHRRCEEPAARNASFLASRSPVPIVAFRHMAIHDILFLRDRREWFTEYHQRFGGRYRAGDNGIEPLFTELFNKACADYGLTT